MTKGELKEKFVELVQSILPNFKDKFTDAKLADGTIISYDADAITVGVIVSIVDTTGAKMPLPKGSYVLEDGTTFDIVDDMGSADNVVAVPEAPEAEAPAEAPMPTMQNDVPATPQATAQAKSIIESVVKETRFEADIKAEMELEFSVEKEKFAKETEELKVKLSKQDETIKAMMTLVEQMGNEPSAKPTEPVKNKFSIAEQRKSWKEDIKKIEADYNKNN